MHGDCTSRALRPVWPRRHSWLFAALPCLMPHAVSEDAAHDAAPAAALGILGVRASSPDADAWQFVQGARIAAGGRALVVPEWDGSAEGLDAAVRELADAGVAIVLGPLDASHAERARAACDTRGLAHLGIDLHAHAIDALVHLVVAQWRTPRVAWFDDGARDADARRSAFERALPPGFALVAAARAGADERSIARMLERDRPHVVLIDAPPHAAAALLGGALAPSPLPVLLLPRAYGDETRAVQRDAFVLLGRSPLTLPESGPFLAAFRAAYGEPGHSAAEGFEAAALAQAAWRAAGGTRDALEHALKEAGVAGPRGAVTVTAEPDAFAIAPPLALWRMRAGKLTPHLPAIIPAAVAEKGTAARQPDPDLGPPFGAFRTASFALEEKTQWVLFTFDDKRNEEDPSGTIDEDLARLGLSTGGRAPLVDHLVKEELMARALAVTSAKFLRNPDGSPIPGKSLRVSFATVLPPRAKAGKAWLAVFSGDDAAAGGRAFGTRAEIYATFIRRTIFQPHALEPPLGPDDLGYLDGSYVYGADHARDRRSELIRSLIEAYAGSMALTAAHEIGHCSGLGHVTDDPLDIMNVEEGAGIDHRAGHFGVTTLEQLLKRFGVVEAPRAPASR